MRFFFLVISVMLLAGCCTGTLLKYAEVSKSDKVKTYYNAEKANLPDQKVAICYYGRDERARDARCVSCDDRYLARYEHTQGEICGGSLTLSENEVRTNCRRVDKRLSDLRADCGFNMHIESDESPYWPARKLAYLGLPVTVAVDVATYPLQLLVIGFMVAGGH